MQEDTADVAAFVWGRHPETPFKIYRYMVNPQEDAIVAAIIPVVKQYLDSFKVSRFQGEIALASFF